MHQLSLKSKIWLAAITGLVAGTSFRRLSIKYLSPWLPPIFLLTLSILVLLVGLIFPFIWHKKESRNAIDSYKVKAILERILIYSFSVDWYMFGWHKIEGLQMIVPLGMLDTPFSEFSGYNLVWAFFRYSYPFTVVIALLQITSALLLLFSRTRLLGIMIAIPMLVFITLLDIFYHMPIGVLAHGLILLTGVVYLLSRDYDRVRQLFVSPITGINSLTVSGQLKNFVRASVCIVPIVGYFIYDYPDKNPDLTGTYSVTDLSINQVAVKAESPQDSVLKKVYFDLENEIAFDFNDYRRRYIGTYQLSQSDSISIKWRYPSTKLGGFEGVLTKQDNQVRLQGVIDGQRVDATLVKSL